MGDVAEVVTSAVEPGQAKVIELNCRALRRVDFGAGTTLIRWVAKQHHQGRRVGFVEVNWMVAAFLDLLGFGDTARVIRRTD
jgi:ABC-type transporter Mla MlaB component